MYARLATFRGAEGTSEVTEAEDQEFIKLLTDQEGCRGAWELVEEGGDPLEALFFSLWETKEQAEAAGANAWQGIMRILEAHGTTDAAPPEVRIFAVVASSG